MKRFMAARVWAFAAGVAVACLVSAKAGMSAALYALALGAIAIAIWHGAFDGVLARPVLEPRLGRRWTAAFVGGYLCLAGAMVVLWWLTPQVALPAFLIYSAWHFGTEADTGRMSLASGMVGLCMGALPIAAACQWHTDAVNAIFAMMLRVPAKEALPHLIAQTAGSMTWPVAIVAVLGALLGVREKGWAARVESVVVVGLVTILFWRCAPLVAFAVYFCLWHTPEHLLTSSQDEAGNFSSAVMWRQLRSGVVPWIAALVMVGLLLIVEPKQVTAYASSVFLVLSALTVPHMSLNELRRHFSSHREVTSALT